MLLDGHICQIEIPKAKSNPFHNTSPGPSMAEMAQNRQTQQLGLQQVHFVLRTIFFLFVPILTRVSTQP